MVRVVLGLMVLAFSVAPALADAAAAAQTAAAPTPEQPAGAAPASAASGAAGLCDNIPDSARLGAPSSTIIQLDPDTLWRPEGSEARFTVANTNGGLPAISQVVVCFRWESTDPAHDKMHYTPSPLVRSIANTTGVMEYGAIIPPSIGAPVLNGAGPDGPFVQRTALGSVPRAEMAVMVQMTGSPSSVAVILPVGVTNVFNAAIVLAACLVISCLILWFLAPRSMLSKTTSWPAKISEHILAVISAPDGIASLSQFQVMLWTFVVAGAAIYVMVLSGNLIAISTQMLTLLGIAGGTQILASVNRDKIPEKKDGDQPTIPRWSNLLIDKNNNDIDVSRVQMLIFTLITAAFVAVQVIATYSIPDIPDNFMVLMGISNGVYLAGRQTAKPLKGDPPPPGAGQAPPNANAASGAGPVPAA